MTDTPTGLAYVTTELCTSPNTGKVLAVLMCHITTLPDSDDGMRRYALEATVNPEDAELFYGCLKEAFSSLLDDFFQKRDENNQ